jgi:type I pantothenate kinase
MNAFELTADDWSRIARDQIDVVDRPSARALDGATDGGAEIPVDATIDAHLPLAELLATMVDSNRDREINLVRILGVRLRPTLIVGITGGVASGKTVTARVLQSILTASGELQVDVVSTDGFLFPNAELEARGLTDRKGFPESFDHAKLIAFLGAVRAGYLRVAAPVYDHVAYDVMADREQAVHRPDVLIIEGLNILQPAPPAATEELDGGDGGLLVSDFLDFSVYLDADEPDVRRWFLQRMQDLRSGSAGDDTSFFAAFASSTDDDFLAIGDAVWQAVNRPNLERHIAPTRHRADLIIEKAADHSVRRVLVRNR